MTDPEVPGPDSPPPGPNEGPALESTQELLRQVRAGSGGALERLIERCRPALVRFASGRLPAYARSFLDTEDLVHDALIKTIHRIDEFELRFDGAFHYYLRRAVLNRIKDERMRRHLQPPAVEIDAEHRDPGPSPHREAVSHEALERYEAALGRLPEKKQVAIHLRFEQGLSFKEIAAELGIPTANAARMMVSRAVAELAREMGYD